MSYCVGSLSQRPYLSTPWQPLEALPAPPHTLTLSLPLHLGSHNHETQTNMCQYPEIVAISSQRQGHNGFREMPSCVYKHSILTPSKLTRPYKYSQTSHSVFTSKLLLRRTKLTRFKCEFWPLRTHRSWCGWVSFSWIFMKRGCFNFTKIVRI